MLDKCDRSDKIFLLILTLISLLFAFYFLRGFIANRVLPFEDAAMLMRYSEHLAGGYGIVWNIGEPPVDGCSDFLYMIILALVIKAGLSAESGAFVIGLLSHYLTVIIVYISIRKLHGRTLTAALISAAIFAVGPGTIYTMMLWGTPFFGLFSALTGYFAIFLATRNGKPKHEYLFAFSSLITGLIRPEGVFLAVFMLLAVMYIRGLNQARGLIMIFIAVFGILGGIYFAWHWWYFGYPLPNPFYRKGGGDLYFDGLRNSIKNAVYFGWFTVPAYILALFSAKTRRMIIFTLIPIVGFTSVWILISPEMNFVGRFQYALFPVFLISWPLLIEGATETFPRMAKFKSQYISMFRAAVLISGLAALLVVVRTYKTNYLERLDYRDGRYDVAVMLHDYSNRGYSIAVSEAGLLPLYSQWTAIDTWGLNDKWITHHGIITEAYLDKYKPRVIMFHDKYPFENLKENDSRYAALSKRNKKWFRMIDVLHDYAIKNGYILAAAFGTDPGAVHYYYVRSDFPESAEIVSRIRNMDYIWYVNNRKATNFATENQASCDPYPATLIYYL